MVDFDLSLEELKIMLLWHGECEERSEEYGCPLGAGYFEYCKGLKNKCSNLFSEITEILEKEDPVIKELGEENKGKSYLR